MTAGHSNAADYGKVAVLLGGRSAEREISLKSGEAVYTALRGAGVEAAPVDPGTPEGMGQLMSGGFDRAFVVLHGRGGEDGVMQGALEALGLPYTGSGVLGSALAMDKVRTKQIWHSAGVPTPEFIVAGSEADLDAVPATLGFPVIVKPAHEGSSIGMTKVGQPAQLTAAWRLAREYDADVLIERWIQGGEYTAAIVGQTLLPLIKLTTPHAFYDFAAKYNADTTQYLCPCGLPQEQEAGLQAQARRAFDVLGASGWGRVDFMLDADDRPYFIEVNTVPGMTDHSLVPMAAKVAGMDFQTLVMNILDTAGNR